MNLEELAKHQKLGIDFDGTLVEHERSPILQQFILDNYRDKEFHIITFRTHDLVDDIEDDLDRALRLSGIPLRLDHFAGIQAIPVNLYMNWRRTMMPPNGAIIRVNSPEADAFFGWKAEICKELGCTVLIDDMEPSISRLCIPHGVVCLNPDHF